MVDDAAQHTYVVRVCFRSHGGQRKEQQRQRGGCGGEASPLHRLAEQRFLVGDVAGALRAAREAQARCRSLPGLAHALAAYDVHAAAAASRASGRNWYAVLSVGARTSLPTGGGGVTHEDIKRRYRRLCLVLHPDKNRSAAADGAFKLLQQAWGALSVRHPPAPRDAAATGVTKPTPSPRPRPPAPPAPAAKPSNHSRPPPPAANNAPRDDDKRRASASETSHSRPPPPAGHAPKAERASADTRHTPASHAHAKPGNHSQPPPPAASAAYTPKDEGSGTDTPPRRQGSRNTRRFPCPAQCVHCGARFASSTVSVGTWHLHCAACHRYARVCVRSPSNAEICR